MKESIIDLETYRTKGSKVFTGRDRGIEVRSASVINELEETSTKIIIKVPSDIMSINPSFLEEFLFNVVTKLGKDEFYKKFLFESVGSRYDVATDLEEAVERILRNENALSSK
jgi:hypothetical protein